MIQRHVCQDAAANVHQHATVARPAIAVTGIISSSRLASPTMNPVHPGTVPPDTLVLHRDELIALQPTAAHARMAMAAWTFEYGAVFQHA